MRKRRRRVDLGAVARLLLRGTRRAAFTLVGFVLVCIGLAGLLLPILPGWVLIVGGFAVLSREYSWAHSALRFARRQAARSGTKLRSLATRRRRAISVADPSGEVVIDLTKVQAEAAETASRASDQRRATTMR